MVLTDVEIRKKGASLIHPFEGNQVSNICYDLKTEAFCNEPGKTLGKISLAPGDTVFVKSIEEITLPNNMCAIVVLRNSRIRQGLDLTAPIYQPGHHTKVFFRITNISKSIINLDASESKAIASIMFIPLNCDVETPYSGTFQNEFDFRGMGNYSSLLSGEMKDIEKKVDNIRNIEKDMYSNVLALLAVFVGIFSLINVNVSLVAQRLSMLSIITLNFTTIGAIGFLIALINTILPSGKHRLGVWLSCICSFIFAIGTQILQWYLH